MFVTKGKEWCLTKPVCLAVRSYKFLFASSGDLALGDVPALLNEYKELVLKYEALRRGLVETGSLIKEQSGVDAVNLSGRFRKSKGEKGSVGEAGNSKVDDSPSTEPKISDSVASGTNSNAQDKSNSNSGNTVFTSLGNSLAAAGDGITSIFRRDSSVGKIQEKQKASPSIIADASENAAVEVQARYPLISLASEGSVGTSPDNAAALKELAATESPVTGANEDGPAIDGSEVETTEAKEQQDASSMDLLSQLGPLTSPAGGESAGLASNSSDSQSLI